MNIDDFHAGTYKEFLEKAEDNWLAVNKPMVYFNQNSSSSKDFTTLLCQRCQSVPLIPGSIDDSMTNNIPPIVQVLTNVTNTTTKSDNFYWLFHKFQGLKGKDQRTFVEKVCIICNVYKKICVFKQIKLEPDSNRYFYRHRFSIIGKCF